MAANAWFAFILFGFIAYVALDGYDLGVGAVPDSTGLMNEFSLLERGRGAGMGRKRVLGSPHRSGALGWISGHVRRLFPPCTSGDSDALLPGRPRGEHRDAVERRAMAARLGSSLHGRIVAPHSSRVLSSGPSSKGCSWDPTPGSKANLRFPHRLHDFDGADRRGVTHAGGNRHGQAPFEQRSARRRSRLKEERCYWSQQGLVVLSGALLPVAGASASLWISPSGS